MTPVMIMANICEKLILGFLQNLHVYVYHVTIEVSSLSNSSRHYCSTGGSKCTLDNNCLLNSIVWQLIPGRRRMHIEMNPDQSTQSCCILWSCCLQDNEFRERKRRFYLPSPNAKAKPQMKKDKPPKQRSAKFLIRIFVTFLLLTEPASINPKPA